MLASPIRRLEVGGKTLVLTLDGDLDLWTRYALESALATRGKRTVIVDLLAARNVERGVQDTILAAAATGDVVVVADTRLLHVFELRTTAPLGLETSLAAAVAACV
jgi:hypothetical protein